MKTISEEEFRALCDAVRTLAPSLLHGANTSAEKTDRLLDALFERVCQHLGIDPAEQRRLLMGPAGFNLIQTLDEHMKPEFYSSPIIDEHLLMRM